MRRSKTHLKSSRSGTQTDEGFGKLVALEQLEQRMIKHKDIFCFLSQTEEKGISKRKEKKIEKDILPHSK